MPGRLSGNSSDSKINGTLEQLLVQFTVGSFYQFNADNGISLLHKNERSFNFRGIIQFSKRKPPNFGGSSEATTRFEPA